MKKVLKLFRSIEYVFLVIPVAALIVCIFANIIIRAYFGGGISWLEEFSRYVFVFSTFLGASVAVETDQNPKMSAVIDLAPPRVSLVLKLIGNLFCAALNLLAAYYGYQQVLRMVANGAMATSLPIPMYIPYLIMPLAMLVSVIRYLCLVVCNVKDMSSKSSNAAL